MRAKPAKKKVSSRLTPAQIEQFKRDHENRLVAINAPLPRVRVLGRSYLWSGVLVERENPFWTLEGKERLPGPGGRYDGKYGSGSTEAWEQVFNALEDA